MKQMEKGTFLFPVCLLFSLCLFLGMLLTASETPKMGIYYIPVSGTAGITVKLGQAQVVYF